MVGEISEFHEKLEAELECYFASLQVLSRSQEGNIHDQCHRKSQFHLPEAKPSAERLSQRYSVAESPVPGCV